MRTDRHRFCAYCGIRFPAIGVCCPGCGDRRSYDTRDPHERARAMQTRRLVLTHPLPEASAVVEPASPPMSTTAKLVAGIIVALIAAGGSYAFWLAGLDPFAFIGMLVIAAIFIWMLAVVVALVVGAVKLVVWVVRAVVRRARKTRSERAVLRIAMRDEVADPPPPVGETIRARGRVRVADPLASPIAGSPCAAFRIVGRATVGPVDDAAATDFTVVTESGEEIHIDDVVVVDVPVTAEPKELEPRPDLWIFLDERALYPQHGGFELAEATIGDGDQVEIEGTTLGVTANRNTARLYREAGTSRLVGRAVVRRISAPAPEPTD